MTVSLVDYTDDALNLIEFAASTCYDSDPTVDYRIMNSCIRNGHTSITEYANFTFKVEGVSRALLAQITRHRVGTSFTVRSQRYCDENNFEYVIPDSIKNNDAAATKYKIFMDTCARAYSELQELGVQNEDARFVLPNACSTTFYVKFNLRSLIHFCNERMCARAQWEIRQLADFMAALVVGKYPELDKYLVPKCESHEIPFCSERNGCGRYKKLSELLIK